MQLNFSPPKNLNGQIVDQLGLRIISGHYKEGEQLPIEADLCAEFGVSRPIMREATKILSAKGLLASRPRVGTVVKNRNCWNLLDSDVLSWVTQALPPEDFLDMMFEARRAFEPAAAELAAQKATDEDIEYIRCAHEDMANANSLEELLEPDIRFHQAIMNATHNDVIRYIGYTLHNALAISIRLTTRDQQIQEESVTRHEAVYQAIAKRDPQAARETTEALLHDSRRDFDTC